MNMPQRIFNKLFRPSPDVLKRRSLERILEAPVQLNNGVVNLHRYDKTNIGDFYCGVHHYFDELNNKQLDIFDCQNQSAAIRDEWVNKMTQSSLIIGGGGLLNRESFSLQMKALEHLAERGKKTVLWGPGHNSKNTSEFGKLTHYNIDTSKFGLVGVRDYGMKEEWVPCGSCLHPIFDEKVTVTNEVGIIFHKNTLDDQAMVKKFEGFPSTANNAVFEDVVKFIGATDTIMTDSYHAMYWSILLGKKVIAFPNSSKFYNFKYQPVISSFDKFEADLKKARSYSGVLEECREANRRFAEKAFDYLNI